jgi:hypothetical protein
MSKVSILLAHKHFVHTCAAIKRILLMKVPAKNVRMLLSSAVNILNNAICIDLVTILLPPMLPH